MDIGSGPTLYQVLSGCEVFKKVLLTDFLEVNRQELRHWLQDKGGCNLDWTPYLQHVCKLEGRRYDQGDVNIVQGPGICYQLQLDLYSSNDVYLGRDAEL